MERARSLIAETGPGPSLRHWRARRRLSQLDLAVEAGVSSRHLSFVETGRAQPSREMVLLLARALDVPLRDRNALTLRYFTTLTTLGTPHDITAQELRIEAFFPADEDTEAATRRLRG